MVKNLISNYIPHEAVTFDDINPQWINKNGKEVIVEKNEMYKSWHEKKFRCLQNDWNSIIKGNKQKYYSCLSNKLIDPKTS